MTATGPTTNRLSRRTRRGSTITEAGPALFILFCLLFFPMLDLLGLLLAYYSGYLLNTWQTREAALLRAVDTTNPAGLIQQGLPEQWRANGLGRFVNIIQPIQTQVEYEAGYTDPTPSTPTNFAPDQSVRVTTTIVCGPYFNIPFLVGIPGISAPFSVRYTNSRHIENPEGLNR